MEDCIVSVVDGTWTNMIMVESIEMDKFTVFFEPQNGIHIQVEAFSKWEARDKATIIYKKRNYIPSSYVQEGWIVESDSEDKE